MTGQTTTANTATMLAGLSFEQTVPRRQVHRSALSEVFLTDSAKIDDSRFVAAAQLPASHTYFTDHTGHCPVDPLLLLECCRQAETHAVHMHFGAPMDTRFILKSWSLRMHPQPGSVRRVGAASVFISASTRDAVWLLGSLRSVAYQMRVSVAGRHLADVEMQVGYLSGEAYAAMRRRRHRGVVPSSTTAPAPTGEVPVPPRSVARTSAANVVLLDALSEGERLRTTLRVASDHPSYFDHAQDHVPGMVLMEAGRQHGLLAHERFTDSPAIHWQLSGLDAMFRSFAELNSPVTIVAQRPVDGGVGIAFEQGGSTVAESTFHFRRG